ncbi:MAG: ABC transporter permease, partial [Muribaculaceae bacterium]|nr:ABC transporter permease [Muribaculaceae bacterium]
MIGLMALPTIIAAVSNPDAKHVAVVNNSGIVGPMLHSDQTIIFDLSEESVDKLRKSEELDAILVIPENALSTSVSFTLLTNNTLGLQSENQISSIVNGTVQQMRLAQHEDIPELGKIMNEVQQPVYIESLKIDGDEDESSSSLASYLIGLLMSFILYMFVLIYGQMIMTSIIEEKNNRVLEIVVSSVRPTQIMLGKIFGIAGVAITQILIWGAIIGLFSTYVMPSLITSALTGNPDMELTSLLTTIGNPGYILGLFGQLAILLILGYLFYSAIFAAIGSAVDNIQDASQLQSIATVPIILAMVFTMTVLEDPNSTLATWLTLIP